MGSTPRPLPAVLATAVLLATTAGASQPVPAGAPVPDLPWDQYIVAFTSLPADRATVLGQPVVSVDEALAHVLVQVTDLAGFHAAARSDPTVRFVEWDDPRYASPDLVPNDPGYHHPGHYGSKRIGAAAAWDRTLGSTAVKVAVIDSGLHQRHEEFASRGAVLPGYDFANRDRDPSDEGGHCGYHGTHTAGIAGAAINNQRGIAGVSQHTILPIKALKSSLLFWCTGSTAAIASALRYAADQGAHVASNSWGGGSASAAVGDAIRYAHAKGVAIVGAAGNGGPCTDCVDDPWRSNADKVVVVACTDASDAPCRFSSQGPQVDVAAPGDAILSTCGPKVNSYCLMSGPSMSVPFVAGAMALLKARDASLTAAQMEARLEATAADLGPPGFDPAFGSGRIDAAAAMG